MKISLTIEAPNSSYTLKFNHIYIKDSCIITVAEAEGEGDLDRSVNHRITASMDINVPPSFARFPFQIEHYVIGAYKDSTSYTRINDEKEIADLIKNAVCIYPPDKKVAFEARSPVTPLRAHAARGRQLTTSFSDLPPPRNRSTSRTREEVKSPAPPPKKPAAKHKKQVPPANPFWSLVNTFNPFYSPSSFFHFSAFAALGLSLFAVRNQLPQINFPKPDLPKLK